MTTISGFTFIHNAIESGYPIIEAIRAVCDYVDEIVVVDMESTDGTRELLEKFARGGYPDFNIINGKWGSHAGETLRHAHALYKECSGDVILHFEADEVYDRNLLWMINRCVDDKIKNISVYRLQLEQNFQRCRWYPEPVHRVWPKSWDVMKEGHTTNISNSFVLDPGYGFLWDITNCFRDNWLNRVRKQAELWHGRESYIMVPLHTTQEAEIGTAYINTRFNEPHWTWETTPFNIPAILRPLVGMTKYEPRW